MFAAAMSLTATVQTDIWYWQNGTATKVETVDSITFTEPQAAAPVTTHEYVDLGLSVDCGGGRYYGDTVRLVLQN
jgi:hypothetical protein